MRCEDAREALARVRYGTDEVSSTLAAHTADCAACAAFAARQQQLDRWLTFEQAPAVRPGFDTSFFARLDAEKTRARRAKRGRWAWALVPLAAGAALLWLRPSAVVPLRMLQPIQVPSDDVALALELDLVENIEVVRKFDEVEAYDVLSQVDADELERLSKEEAP